MYTAQPQVRQGALHWAGLDIAPGLLSSCGMSVGVGHSFIIMCQVCQPRLKLKT